MAYTSLGNPSCDATAEAATTLLVQLRRAPSPVAPGGVITPPSSAPPEGETWTLYDTNGNELYSTVGVYEPGATTAAYLQTIYTLYQGQQRDPER